MWKFSRQLIPVILWLLACTVVAQDNDILPSAANSLDIEKAVASATGKSELTVLAPTLPPQLIDQAVLNRMMEEIARTPEAIQQRLNINEMEMQDIFIVLSNASSFINNNEMANVRAMCRAFRNSELEGDARIQQALDAYKRRAGFTHDFIARYYRIVLADLEANLPPHAVPAFQRYMDDRRARMANAGVVTSSAVVENIESGRESVEFHCRGGA